MLNIFCGRENIDKDRFMFDRIGETLECTRRRVLLIVPEQYTLQAERNAFACLDAPGFIDFEVLSMTSLGRRVLSETGDGDRTFIDQYGKFMLISGLLRKNKQALHTFRNLENSPAFVDKLNHMIAELKNFNVSPTELRNISEDIEGDSLLKRKLADAAVIYAGYEDRLGGRHIDTADYLKLFTARIADSDFIAESEIWLAAFDYLSPAALDTVTELIVRARSVNLVLTAEAGTPFFQLTNALADEVERRASDAGVKTETRIIGDAYAHRRPGPIAHIEKTFFSYPRRTPYAADTDARRGAIRLVAAANYYAEAETAAAHIAELVRDEGLRYRDILVLCNDMGARVSVIRRVFARYGLPIFVDRRRGVEHNPALEYILALLSIVSGGWPYEAVFRLLKTGLTDIERESWEELENYVCKYKIRGSLWKRDFTYGFLEYTQEEMDAFNAVRRRVARLFESFEEPFRRGATVGGKTERLRRFLTETAKLPDAADRLTMTLEESGEPDFAEYAAEMSGIWDVVAGIFDQLIAALGDLPVSVDEYAGILKTGFSSVRMGILPPSPDRIVVGTTQRTRSGEARAIFVLGANDGVLPTVDADDAILNEDEKARLTKSGHEIGRANDKMLLEEQLAIYRNLSKPQRLLYMSCSVSDDAGRDAKPSIIFEQLRRMFPRVPVEKDMLNDDGDPMRLFQYREEAMSHLTEGLQRWIAGGRADAVRKDAYLWFKAHPRTGGERDDMANLRAGLTFRNRRERIDEGFVAALYGAAGAEDESARRAEASPALVTSPSALERFSRCPFAFFMDRGVKIKERRVFEIDGRNVGDVYHEVLMRYGTEMIRDGLSVSDEHSAWRTVTESESAALVGRIYDEAAVEFKEGLFHGGGYERYKSERIKRIASDVAWILTEQVRAGAITDMRFETAFGAGGMFPPIETEQDSKRVRVQGRIDRLDILEGGYARIIDYKSGADTFSREDVLNGWQLQLMLYMMTVRDRYKPAGVFYFKIAEPRAEDTGDGDVTRKIARGFRLDGISVNDPRVAAAIGEPVRSAEPGEFEVMQTSVDALVSDLCGKLLSGNIDAKPLTARKIKAGASGRPMTACTYCSYRGICNFDRVFG
ncbi:MAG: exodeoxyribonuclease V subunit gamma [Clostridiales Family XIII bacterium]|jgi:ATP-dependent helicase/nuclease subunit B|nr:exodeoxyribonuclease V subunit gamma [Clostridiales Family XIII bacterium]